MKLKLLFWLAGFSLLLAIGIFFWQQEAVIAPTIEQPASSTPGATAEQKLAVGLRVAEPTLNQVVESPLKIKGEAQGFWFFEAVFPIKLLDEAGHELARGTARAQGDWMTEDFVPFTAELKFKQPLSGSTGKLILSKDNPSGLPANEGRLAIPVKFK